jgi:hypothetical protein
LGLCKAWFFIFIFQWANHNAHHTYFGGPENELTQITGFATRNGGLFSKA